MSKKIISVLLTLVLCVSLVQTVAMAEQGDEWAEITFARFYQTKHIKSYGLADLTYDNMIRTQKLGRECVMMRSTVGVHLGVDVDDKFIKPNVNGTEVEIQVDYFDDVAGSSFGIRYNTTWQERNESAGACWTEGTGEWKTHTFILKDAVFNNKMYDAYDFTLSTRTEVDGASKNPVYFGAIRIRELPAQMLTAKMTTDYSMNAFDGESEAREFKFHLENRKNTPVNTNIKVIISDYLNGNVVATAEKENITVDKKLDTSVTVEYIPYGSFNVQAVLDCTDKRGVKRTQTIENYCQVLHKFKDEQQKNEYLGISAHIDRLYHGDGIPIKEDVMHYLSYMGVGYIRTDWHYKEFSDSTGAYAVTPAESIPEDLGKYKIKTMPILIPKGIKGSVFWKIPKEYDLAVKWMEEAAKALNGRVEAVEMYNEIDLHDTPEGIANLYKRIYPILKKAGPDIEYIGLAYARKEYPWLKKFLEVGGGEYMDKFSVHHYDYKTSFTRWFWDQNHPEMIKMLAEHGFYAPDDIWFSEQGWSTSKERSYGVTDYSRAKDAVRYWVYLRGNNRTKHFFVYNMMNLSSNEWFYENQYGILRDEHHRVAPGAPFPICVTLNAMNYFVGMAEPQKQLIVNNNQVPLYMFKHDDGKQVICSWSDEQKDEIANVDLGTNSVDVYDMFGNFKYTLRSDNGVYSLPVQKEPQYYIGNFSKLEEGKPIIGFDNAEIECASGDTITFKVQSAAPNAYTYECESSDFDITDGGEGKFTLKVNSDCANGNYPISVKVKKDGYIYFDGCLNVKVGEPIEVKQSVVNVINDQYQANLTVTNTSKRVLSGVVDISEPEDIAKYANSVNVVDLKPGETKTYTFRLPEMKNMRRIETKLDFKENGGNVFSYKNKTVLAPVAYAKTKPEIDGNIAPNEWNSKWLVADKRLNVALDKVWNGPKDHSFSTNLMWDENNMYLAVDVVDDAHYQPYRQYNMWNADSLQFAFNSEPDPTVNLGKFESFALTLVDSGETEFLCGRSTKGIPCFELGEDGMLRGYNVKVKRNGNHTVYEAEIPWTVIFGKNYTFNPDDFVQFAIIVNDRDSESGGRGYTFYADGIGGTRDTTQMAKLEFIK